MIIRNWIEYMDMFGNQIGIFEPSGMWVFSVPIGEKKVRVFDLSEIDEKRLNQLIDESLETGVDKVYDAVKEYEIEIPKCEPGVVY